MSSVSKSYNTEDPVGSYCLAHSSSMHPVQKQLMEETLKHSWYHCLLYLQITITFRARMLGAPEVLAVNSLLIHR